MKTINKLWFGILILALLSPLGLILPAYFKAGGAWGEDGGSRIWKALFPNYAFRNQQEKGLPQLSLAYIISALIGILVTVLIVLLIARSLAKKNDA